MRSSLISALTAISLIAAPTASLAAAPGGAASLSLSQAVRSGAPVRDVNRMDETGYIIAGVAAVVVIIFFFVILDDDDDEPSSP